MGAMYGSFEFRFGCAGGDDIFESVSNDDVREAPSPLSQNF